MTEIPEYSMERSAGRPFDPAPTFRIEDPAGSLRRVRLWDGSTPWLVTGYAHQRALLADARVSSEITAPGFPNFSDGFGESGLSFLMMDDPNHNRLRRMVIPSFTVKRVETMRQGIHAIVDKALDAMVEKPRPVDLVEEFALPVPSLVICELLGVPYHDHDFFQVNSKTFIHAKSTRTERADAISALAGYVNTLIESRLSDPADDMLSGLADRVRREELTIDEASEIGILMLIGGHETTANMIALGTLALLRHPDQLAYFRAVLDDQAKVATAVEELLRYLTITHSGRRRAALADIEIDGHTIRAGEGLILINETGNRDPRVYPDPDRLDLSRDAHGHLAFGFGVHQCLGQPLARLELQIAFPELLRRLPTLRLGTDIDRIPFKHDGLVYGVYELPITW
jgi:cytochrome P450